MALTSAEKDNLLKELTPHVDTDEKKLQAGLGAYTKLLTAHPEYISHFTKLKGLTLDNVFQSEAIKHYATTLVDSLVAMLKASADEAELKKLLEKSGKDHTTRNVNKAEFMSGQPIFISYFVGLLHDAQNKVAIEKFFNHVFPTVAEAL
ncbi:unnamed protein product [Calicophoron daubneyi]|uniref:Globin domain-containing protein n=1 Tax=Calicophoron daubneyi TaxID=300641 RepID=A0AAV2TII7_CALDB